MDGTSASDAAATRRVLFPLVDGGRGTAFEVALDVAAGLGADLYVLAVHGDDAPDVVQNAAHDAATYALRGRLDEHPVDIHPVTASGRRVSTTVANAVDRYDVDVLVVDDARTDGDRLAARVPCDAVVVPDTAPVEDVRSVLASVAGGPHSGAVLDVGRAVAAANDAWLEILHVVDETAADGTGAAYLDECVARVGDYDDVDTWLHEADDVADAIVEQSEYYDVTVLGVPRAGRLRRFIFGSTTTTVRYEAPNRVLMARRGSASTL